MHTYFISKSNFLSLPFPPPLQRNNLSIRNPAIKIKGHKFSVTMASSLSPKPRILVAGGGVGGLVFAIAARNRGFEVVVLERDMTAVRGEGKYRGPIQLQSNALAALEAIDMDVADQVMDAACVTGNRINGIADGLSGSWYHLLSD
jgi:heterodisulfide reductase subunit A-like polyferredoxin